MLLGLMSLINSLLRKFRFLLVVSSRIVVSLLMAR